MIRPQMKRTKEAKQFREGIASGDKIVTIGGIHGKVLEVADTTILISSEGTKFRIEKSSISPNSMDQLGNQQQR
jgi:preprotein translocase subunit YajC